MSHGTQDWGGKQLDTVFILTEDLAELAARLGSVASWDRRGRVLWLDDFSGGIAAWYAYSYGVGAATEVSVSYPKWPPFCAKLTGGSDAGGVAGLYGYLGPIATGKLGLEASVAFFTAFDYFRMEFEYYDGANWHGSGLEISDTNDKLYYIDSDAAKQELDDLLGLTSLYGRYHSIKLVVDFTDDVYVRAKFNQSNYDLSTYALRNVVDATSPYLFLQFYLIPRLGNNDYCQIDGVILTGDED